MTLPNSNENEKGISRWWNIAERLAIDAPIVLIAMYLILSVVGDIKYELRTIRDRIDFAINKIERR